MGLWDWLAGGEQRTPTAGEEIASAPAAVDIAASLAGVEKLVSDPAVPAVVRARALAITSTVRNTLPRLGLLGLGSYDAYSVVATATDYLPEAIGGYLRLPRDWADARPVESGKSALLLLIDQLDLLWATMESIYDAANTTDAAALITHGRFLTEKFGHIRAAELNLTAPSPAPAGSNAESLETS